MTIGLHTEVTGEGPPVVLLHAGVVDSRIWSRVVPLLAARHTVVTYDQRGYGRSPAWDGPYSSVGDLLSVLDELELERAALVGLSRGGRIALDFALAHPGRVSALVLVASALGGRPLELEGTPEQEARWADAEQRGNSAELAELDLEVWAPLGADEELRRMFVENADASNAEDPEERLEPPAATRLSEVAVPTLVITGSHDVRALAAVADDLVAGIAGARRAEIANADHMVPWRQPEELARLVLEFLASRGERIAQRV